MHKNNGFTLAELLVASVIMSIIAGAVYVSFSSGIRIWNRVNQRIKQEHINIFMEKITSDLKNTFRFSQISFEGTEDSLKFATLVNVYELESEPRWPIVEVSYFLNKETNTVNRQIKNFSQIYKNEKGTIQKLLKDIHYLKFKYYFYDPRREDYFWQSEWNDNNEGLPIAVKVELGWKDNQTDRFIKTIAIPVSS